MNWVLFLFLFFPFFSYLCFQFVPTGKGTWFSIIFIIYLGIIFVLYLYEKIFLGFNFQDLKNSRFVRSIIVVHLFFVSLIFFLVGYHDFYRWKIEPNGMLDAIELWNVKAKLIGEDFLNSKSIFFHDSYWKFDSYPIGHPLTLAFFTVLNRAWSLNIVYTYNIFLSLLCTFLFINYLIQKQFTLVQTVLSWILFFSFMLEFNVLMNHSSLVADFPIFTGVFCLTYLYFSKWTRLTPILFALNISWLLFTKNEGLFYLPVGIIFFLLKLRNLNSEEEPNLRQAFLKFLIVLILCLVPILLHKLESDFIPQDFKRKEKLEWTFSFFMNKLEWILSYAATFHLKFQMGIPFVILFFFYFFSKKNLEKYSLSVIMIGLVLVYILPYFFSNYDHTEAAKFLGEAYRKLNSYEKEIYHMKEHLESSFHRINTHYLPIFFFVGLKLIRSFEWSREQSSQE